MRLAGVADRRSVHGTPPYGCIKDSDNQTFGIFRAKVIWCLNAGHHVAPAPRDHPVPAPRCHGGRAPRPDPVGAGDHPGRARPRHRPVPHRGERPARVPRRRPASCSRARRSRRPVGGRPRLWSSTATPVWCWRWRSGAAAPRCRCAPWTAPSWPRPATTRRSGSGPTCSCRSSSDHLSRMLAEPGPLGRRGPRRRALAGRHRRPGARGQRGLSGPGRLGRRPPRRPTSRTSPARRSSSTTTAT